MQTRVTIDGFRARFVIDYLYATTRFPTQGTFQLRLPEDASPTTSVRRDHYEASARKPSRG